MGTNLVYNDAFSTKKIIVYACNILREFRENQTVTLLRALQGESVLLTSRLGALLREFDVRNKVCGEFLRKLCDGQSISKNTLAIIALYKKHPIGIRDIIPSSNSRFPRPPEGDKASGAVFAPTDSTLWLRDAQPD